MRSLNRRRLVSHSAAIVQTENLEERAMLDASGAVAEAAGFDYFESRDQFAEQLVQQALSRYENQFDQPTWGGWLYPYAVDGDVDVLRAQVELEGFSDTNTQVDGVDEADIIENDGQYLYLIRGDNLVIIDAAQPDEMSVVASIQVEGSPTAIFLHEGTLTVISRGWDSSVPEPASGGVVRLMIADWYWPGTPQTIVTSFDVSNPTEPAMLQQTTIEGGFTDARAIDGKIHVFTNDNVSLPAPRTVPIEIDPEADDQEDADDESDSDVLVDRMWKPTHQYESRETYEAWIREQLDTLVDEALPEYEMIGAGGVVVSGLVSDFDEIAKFDGDDTTSLLSIVTIDPLSERMGLAASTSVFANARGSQYATAEHLYMSSTHYTESGQETRLLQFQWATADSNVQLVASGSVSGRLLNQFSMDEHDGYLRVATTTRFGGDVEVRAANNVYVLENVNGRLTQVGAIEGFEENETIFAVRFSGDRAFIVTFERIDPLFMIDLSDPTSPQITGELEVPGVSTYLQRIDDDHLLAIGTIENATKVSVYDISNATAPTLVDEDVLPQWTRSVADYDHHAFGWFSQHQTLALPVTNGHWRDGQRSELLTFKVDTSLEGEDVIKRRGAVSDEGVYVKRGAFIGDVLYTITTDSVIATDFAGKEELGRVDGISEVEGEPQEIRPVFAVSSHGTGDWIDVNPGRLRAILTQAIPRFVRSLEGNDFQVLIPEQDGAVEITMSGNTLTVTGELGDETLEFPENADLIIKGTPGDDQLDIDLSGAGEGVLRTVQVRTHAGDDTVNINGMADGLVFAKISGGYGGDTIVVDSDVSHRLMLFGNQGNDTVTGGSGNDLLSGGRGNDMMYGGAGNDRMIGRSGADRMWGHGGDDVVIGGTDDDRMHGGRGNDLMRGGRGNDRIHGSNGADVLEGNEGDDSVFGNFGDDTLLDAATSTVNDLLSGGSGKDRFIGGTVPQQELVDRLFDFTLAEDLIAELWNA